MGAGAWGQIEQQRRCQIASSSVTAASPPQSRYITCTVAGRHINSQVTNNTYRHTRGTGGLRVDPSLYDGKMPCREVARLRGREEAVLGHAPWEEPSGEGDDSKELQGSHPGSDGTSLGGLRLPTSPRAPRLAPDSRWPLGNVGGSTPLRLRNPLFNTSTACLSSFDSLLCILQRTATLLAKSG